MKKINNIYLATEKEGSIEENMAELPENPGGYSAIFTSLDRKFVEKALKSLSETINAQAKKSFSSLQGESNPGGSSTP